MLKIGVISDTHLDKVSDEFKNIIKMVFHDIDMIIHSGDMTSRAVYDYFSNWDLRAVRGNMDDFDLSGILPEKRVEEIGGKKIGIIHGRGSPYVLSDLVFKEFQYVDIIIFGHSHVPFHKRKGNVEMFNPGAFKGSPGQAGTIGLIEIGEEVRLTHIKVS